MKLKYITLHDSHCIWYVWVFCSFKYVLFKIRENTTNCSLKQKPTHQPLLFPLTSTKCDFSIYKTLSLHLNHRLSNCGTAIISGNIGGYFWIQLLFKASKNITSLQSVSGLMKIPEGLNTKRLTSGSLSKLANSFPRKVTWHYRKYKVGIKQARKLIIRFVE